MKPLDPITVVKVSLMPPNGFKWILTLPGVWLETYVLLKEICKK